MAKGQARLHPALLCHHEEIRVRSQAPAEFVFQGASAPRGPTTDAALVACQSLAYHLSRKLEPRVRTALGPRFDAENLRPARLLNPTRAAQLLRVDLRDVERHFLTRFK